MSPKARSAVAIAIITGGGFGGPLHAAAAAPALFTAFQTLCIETDAVPATVTDAIIRFGGGSADAGHANGDGTQTWSITFAGQPLTITAGVLGDRTRSCMLESSTDDEQSVAAARAWIGIPPSQAAHSAEIYDYVLDAAYRIDPTPKDKTAFLQARAAGRTATLGITHLSGRTDLVLLRDPSAEAH